MIRDRKLERRPPSFSGLFCFIGPAEFAYLRILPSPSPLPPPPEKKKNLLMPLVYYHLKHGIKKTKQNKSTQVPIVIMVLSFKIKNQQMQNKSSRLKQITHRWPLNWVYLFILWKRQHVKTELLKDKALRGRKKLTLLIRKKESLSLTWEPWKR